MEAERTGANARQPGRNLTLPGRRRRRNRKSKGDTMQIYLCGQSAQGAKRALALLCQAAVVESITFVVVLVLVFGSDLLLVGLDLYLRGRGWQHGVPGKLAAWLASDQIDLDVDLFVVVIERKDDQSICARFSMSAAIALGASRSSKREAKG